MALRQAWEKRGMPDLLYYSHFGAPGIVILKDGSLLRIYRLRGPDLKSAVGEELAALTHHGNQALVRLDDGWMLQTDLVRYPSIEYQGGGAFPDATTKTIEHERELHYRREGTPFETSTYLTLTWTPPSRYVSWGRKLFFTQKLVDEERNLITFRTATDALAHDLSAYLELTPLDNDETLSFIESSIIGEQVAVRAPRHFSELDAVLGRHRLVVGIGMRPTIGGRAIRIVVPSGFPIESDGEVSAFLCELPFAYRYSIRAKFLGTQTANQELGTKRKHWHQKILRMWDFLKQSTGAEALPTYRNELAVDMAEDANEAIREAQSNTVRYLYLAMGVVITDADAGAADGTAKGA
jgi:type IV secretion system protein VirB4